MESIVPQIPKSFDEFDFAFPYGAYGNSSGWLSTIEFSLKRQPDLAPRRLTLLRSVGGSLLFRMIDGELTPPRSVAEINSIPFVRKGPFNPMADDYWAIGLSSGGGSALFRSEGTTYKIKRCGLADRGFIEEPFDTHISIPRDGDHFELTQRQMGGLMGFPDALIECRMTQILNDNGLCRAYRPVGVIMISALPDSPFAKRSIGAVVTEVESDLRVDELVHMALSPVLAEAFEQGRLAYDPHSGFFEAKGIPVARTLSSWPHILERVELLGLSVGSMYRRVHDAGYVRGIGSSWFGNEVVDASGEISIVDFDGGTNSMSAYSREIATHIMRMEFNNYCSESFVFLTDMRPKSIALFGNAFIDAVRQGYRESYRPIPREVVRDIIQDHLDVFPQVRSGFGFPVDAPVLDGVVE